jgi:hypothetical protein
MAAIAEQGRLPRRRNVALMALAVVAAAVLAAALALWAYYGTAVFFDMLAAGIAYCL